MMNTLITISPNPKGWFEVRIGHADGSGGSITSFYPDPIVALRESVSLVEGIALDENWSCKTARWYETYGG